MKKLLIAISLIAILTSCKKVPMYGEVSINVTTNNPSPEIYIALFQGWINPNPRDLLQNDQGYYLMGTVQTQAHSEKLPIGSYTVIVVDKNRLVYSVKKIVVENGEEVKLIKDLKGTGFVFPLKEEW